MPQRKNAMRPVNKSDPELIQKVSAFIGGKRTEKQQVELVQNGIVIFVDLLRAMTGDEFVKGFLNGALQSINKSEPPLFSTQEITKH